MPTNCYVDEENDDYKNFLFVETDDKDDVVEAETQFMALRSVDTCKLLVHVTCGQKILIIYR